jgi:hypothetical protein
MAPCRRTARKCSAINFSTSHCALGPAPQIVYKDKL